MSATAATSPTPRYCAGTRRDGSPCRRRLLDLTEGGLRPGARVEIKCKDCNHLNVFEGTAARQPSEADA